VLLDVSDNLYFVILNIVSVFGRLRVMQIMCLPFQSVGQFFRSDY
jgi:hypothetical protein